MKARQQFESFPQLRTPTKPKPNSDYTRGNFYSSPLSPASGSSSTSTPSHELSGSLLWGKGSPLHRPNRIGGVRLETIHGTSPTTPYGPSRGLGYFAFPPSNVPAEQPSSSSETNIPEDSTESGSSLPEEATADTAADQEQENELEMRRRQKMREDVEAEARRGEESWVRSGGILRDERGMRDLARTETMRTELKLRDWEMAARLRWEEYESRWKALLASEQGGHEKETTIRFEDIPWPIHVNEGNDCNGREIKPEDLVPTRVKEFLLEGLKVRGCTTTKKERVRSSLLRWHPDKMTGILARVVTEDIEKVTDGIRIVIECLQVLNART